MPARISSRPHVATPRPAARTQNLPALSANKTMSKTIDKAIVSPEKKKEVQLKFSGGDFKAPGSGNRLQTVYLDSKTAKAGLSITYVDAKGKQFWAQSPGVSGKARGPFALPAGVGAELAKATKAMDAEASKPARPANHGRGVRESGGSSVGSEGGWRARTVSSGSGRGGSWGGGGGGGGGS